MPTLLQAWALPAALLAIANISATWYNLVTENVPDPYLDEFFHVPQAQRYCNNDYTWDPKITTPPGLYLASLLVEVVAGCDTSSLRALNAGAICLICVLTYQILRVLRDPASGQTESTTKEMTSPGVNPGDQTSPLDAHSALNISLFPPLFFFSGLYYTDVTSTLIVLLSYYVFLKRKSTGKEALGNVTIVILGLLALFFRQTNIFWVAVFPAGLSVFDALKSNSKPTSSTPNNAKSIISSAWSQGQVYDCSVTDAGLQVAIAALFKPLLVLKTVLPYLILLGSFAGFVVWNGGVVLGDKSAHVATIHLPQMLYFWTYIVFFSIPLTMGAILRPILPLLPRQLRAFCEGSSMKKAAASNPSIISAVIFLVCGMGAVHYNTLVHPYTLADNRHFVFYAFRILRRHAAIKYAAVPVYYICAWMTVQSLGAEPVNEAGMKRDLREQCQTVHGHHKPCQVSFIIIWLAATTLSVITAPLVEPRYFIIPWIIWRLHVPTVSQLTAHDFRLILETLWFLAIDWAVGYNFLYHGFTWPSEPGKVQRFLW